CALFPYTTLFRSWRKGERRLDLVFALDDQGVREVDAGGVDIDDNLIVLGDRIGGLFQRQRAGRSVGFAQYGFHGGSLIGYFPQSRSEEHTSELQSRENLVCRLLLEKK